MAAAPGVPVMGTSKGLKPASVGVEGNCNCAKNVTPVRQHDPTSRAVVTRTYPPGGTLAGRFPILLAITIATHSSLC
jgi:hypothetical protein